jgi:hypothetical protein
MITHTESGFASIFVGDCAGVCKRRHTECACYGYFSATVGGLIVKK